MQYFTRQRIVKTQTKKCFLATPINLGEMGDGVFLILFLERSERVVCSVEKAQGSVCQKLCYRPHVSLLSFSVII